MTARRDRNSVPVGAGRPWRAARRLIWATIGGFLLVHAGSVYAQDAALLDQDARSAFAAAGAPSPGPAQSFGGYANGCLAGALRLAATGPGWQAMRPSRNRAYGHPSLIAFVERLGASARRLGWPGVLIGDMTQPRGGPMRSGHRSHQSGIDVDIWLRAAPERVLSVTERETLGSPSMVRPDRMAVASRWTATHADILRAAAEDPETARIFVNPAIKKRLCDATSGENRDWLRKIRPWWGHDSHFHVRLHCPADSPGCVGQEPPPPGDGCDALDWWFTAEAAAPQPTGAARKPTTLADLPPACRALVGDR